MKTPKSVNTLENLGRQRLSKSFFMRDFLYSEIAAIYGMPNVPEDPDLALEVGKHLCEELLEPLQDQFGRIAIRSAYRSCEVNALGNERRHNCSSNEANYAGHIWDRRNADGHMGATACVVVPRLADYIANGGSWQAMAWWIRDHLRYADVEFFAKLGAFNISWHEKPERYIYSYAPPKGILTKPGYANFEGTHEHEYRGLLGE